MTDKERIAEPSQDKVEEVAKMLGEFAFNCSWEGLSPEGQNTARSKVREILKLFPEYEPVELEALGDEETELVTKENTPSYSWGKAEWGNILHAVKLGVQATIRHNQAKGQLFRVKE